MFGRIAGNGAGASFAPIYEALAEIGGAARAFLPVTAVEAGHSGRGRGQHAELGDTRTAALVSGQGAIDWMCLPRFDGEPVFGRLVFWNHSVGPRPSRASITSRVMGRYGGSPGDAMPVDADGATQVAPFTLPVSAAASSPGRWPTASGSPVGSRAEASP